MKITNANIMIVLAFLVLLVTPSSGFSESSWNSVMEYFESPSIEVRPLKFKAANLSKQDVIDSFFGKHWLSFVMCDQKKIADYPEADGKLTDYFENYKLTQWRYPGYKPRVSGGLSAFPYTEEVSEQSSIIGLKSKIPTLRLNLYSGINDELVIQPYIVEQTGELIFVYEDDRTRVASTYCSGNFMAIYVPIPES